MIRVILILVLFTLGVGSFLLGIHRSKRDQFYSDTHWLIPLGIFVWGDALILGPFWAFSALAFWWLPVIWIIRYLSLFYAMRSAYEVVYWINHQVAKRDYQPSMFRKISWIGANEAAILYQLLNMVQVIAALGVLMASY